MDPKRASLCLLLLLVAACASTDSAAPPNSMTSAASTSTAVQTEAAHKSYDKPGFATDVVDGRLWIFRADSAELTDYKSMGEPAKHVIRPGVGPMGMTVKGADNATIDAYLKAVGK